jgi:hypothetical protein
MGDEPNALTTICDQRTRFLSSRIPPTRVEIFNPYIISANNQYTQHDYDMRRKTEILQYRSTRMTSQTNSLTKKQQFALVARGNFVSVPSTVSGSGTSTDLSGTVCPNDDYVPTPSTSAGVPGPNTTLYLDKKVPLYRFGAPVLSYPFSISNIENTKFRTDTSVDILTPHNQEKEFCMLIVNSIIDQPNYNFVFSFPVGIKVMGVIENNNLNKPLPITISIYQLSLNIYYSNGLVQSVNIPLTLSNLSFNIANQNGQYRTGSFNAVLYVGYINSPHIRLLTEAGYVYQIKVLARLTATGSGENYFSSLSLYAILNKTKEVLKLENNCTITSSPSIIPNNGFLVSIS